MNAKEEPASVMTLTNPSHIPAPVDTTALSPSIPVGISITPGGNAMENIPRDQSGNRLVESTPEARAALEQADRERFTALIAKARGDIEYICDEIEKINGQRPLNPFSIKKPGPGRPRSALPPRAELDALQLLRAWLHSKLIRLRGEPIFAAGSMFDRLAAQGLVAAPREPTARGRGRTKDKRDESTEALRFYVSVLTARPFRGRDKELGVREALRIIQPYMRSRYKKASDLKTWEVSYHRELSRLRKRTR